MLYLAGMVREGLALVPYICLLAAAAKSFFAPRTAVCRASLLLRPWSDRHASLRPLRGRRPTLQSPSTNAHVPRPHLAGRDLQREPRRNRCATSPLLFSVLVHHHYESLQAGSRGALSLLAKIAHLRHAHRHRRAVLRYAATRMCLGGLCELYEECEWGGHCWLTQSRHLFAWKSSLMHSRRTRARAMALTRTMCQRVHSEMHSQRARRRGNAQ